MPLTPESWIATAAFLLITAIFAATAASKLFHQRWAQRLAPLDALKAMTINAARQYGEQEQKGSLEPGKLADMVILDRNPLEGDRAAIKDIEVLVTIKEGKTIYKRP